MSALMAWIGNCNRVSDQGEPFRPRDFDPYAEPEPEETPWPITILKDVFIDSAYAKSQMKRKEGVKCPEP